MTRMNQPLVALLSIVLVAGGGLVLAGGYAGAQAQQSTAAVTIADQPSDGHTVVVDSVTVPEGGFVVVHNASLADGEVVGSVVGVSSYLEPGTHEDVPVTLARPLENASDVEVTAMPHQDTNGNEVFDFVTANGTTDGAYTTGADGTPVTDTATIDTVGDLVPRTNLQFSEQSSNGTTVTVDNVTLYRGGYVTIHDTSMLQSGDAVGSVVGHSEYLPPGTYHDVQVTLAEPLFKNTTSASLTVMPHHETNGNLVYDFVLSGGAADGPYVANGSAVTATATVSQSSTGGSTATPGGTTETGMTTPAGG